MLIKNLAAKVFCACCISETNTYRLTSDLSDVGLFYALKPFFNNPS